MRGWERRMEEGGMKGEGRREVEHNNSRPRAALRWMRQDPSNQHSIFGIAVHILYYIQAQSTKYIDSECE